MRVHPRKKVKLDKLMGEVMCVVFMDSLVRFKSAWDQLAAK